MKFIKKSTVVEAMQWTGDNLQKLRDFAGPHLEVRPINEFADGLYVIVPEGEMWARPGDWVIKEGDMVYPVIKEVFDLYYVELENEKD